MPSPHPTPRLLLVDDDVKFCELLAAFLSREGYEVACAHTGADGVARALAESWQAVLLDVMMPRMDGFAALRAIRRKSDVPVLMLTARGGEEDRVAGLDDGADDYLAKTFSRRELLARIRAVTRRGERRPQPGEPQPPASAGPLHLDPNTRAATFNGAPLVLTPVEFDVLLALVRAAGCVCTREQLIERIRERDYDAFDRSIDMQISTLRRKLGDDPRTPRFIHTIRATGYMFTAPTTP